MFDFLTGGSFLPPGLPNRQPSICVTVPEKTFLKFMDMGWSVAYFVTTSRPL